MSPAFEYLLKVSVSLAMVSLLYTFLLSRFTFYTWNRWYLRFASVASFSIPAININPSLPVTGRLAAVREIPSIGQHYPNPPVKHEFHPHEVETFNPANWIWIVFSIGIVILLVRLVIQYISLLKLRKSASLVSAEDVEIYHVEKKIAPFSFGNAIFYNPDSHSETELKDIILHEYIHVKERHTSDVIFGEILCILNWYNPFAWLIRRSIRQNLEYIADRAVLANEVDRREYQYLLLKVAGYPGLRLGNAFNMSMIKRRILMMNKQRTPRILLLSFALIVPLAVVLLLVFRREDSANLKPAAFSYDLDSTALARLKNDRRDLIISGLILDARTLKPVPGFALQVSKGTKPYRKIWTDMSGFYYLAVPADSSDEAVTYRQFFTLNSAKAYPAEYTVSSESAPHKRFSYPESRLADLDGMGSYMVIFAPLKNEYNAPTNLRRIMKSELPAPLTSASHELRNDLYVASEKMRKEQQMIVAFKDRYPRPTNVITKFQNGYFDRDRQLMGNEGEIEFYLDGKQVDYSTVNATFSGSPYMLKSTQEYFTRAHDGEKEKRFYLTFDLHKPAPPAALMAGNVETISPQNFNPAILKTQPYLLDGFRQTYGVGSNMMPEKKDIVKIMRFKGRLARYYDRKEDEIWWIETRPAAEVFERPDFAALQ